MVLYFVRALRSPVRRLSLAVDPHVLAAQPQDTTEEMGPTGLLPRSQYFTRDHEGALQGEDQLDNREPDGRMASDELSQRDECLREAVHNLEPDSLLEEMKAVVPGGSCVLMHCAQHTLPLHFFAQAEASSDL